MRDADEVGNTEREIRLAAITARALGDLEAERIALDRLAVMEHEATVCCTNCDGRKCMGCVTRECDHTCADDCPDCCAANLPVTYPGGTLWAVRYNQFDQPHYIMRELPGGDPFTREEAEAWFADAQNGIKHLYPDRPELRPQLVSADITWQVRE